MTAKRIFSFDEARATLPEVRRLTEAALRSAETLSTAIDPEGRVTGDVGDRLQAVVAEWATQVQALGAEVKGLWLVDFDNGSGYYCWQHPEPDLSFYHSYEEAFRGRMRIQ